MKKIFTLIAGALMAIGAQAQTITWDAPIDKGNVPGTYGENFVLTVVDTDSKIAVDANNAYFGTEASQTKFTHRLKTGGKSSAKNSLTLTIPSSGTLKVYVRTGSNSATDRNLILSQGGSELYNKVVQEADAVGVVGLDETDPTKAVNVYPIIAVTVAAGTVDISYPVGGLNFYGFEFVAGEGGGGEEGGGEGGEGDEGKPVTLTFTEALAAGSANLITLGDDNCNVVFNGGAKASVEEKSQTFAVDSESTPITFSYQWKPGGGITKTDGGERSITISVPQNGVLTVCARTGKSGEVRNFSVIQNETTLLTAPAPDGKEIDDKYYKAYEASVAAGTVNITAEAAINIAGLIFTPTDAPAPVGIKGDVNGDGIVNGTDIQAVINFIVAGEYDEKADVNKDGKVNGTDIQEIINIIVSQD
jgi:hypothetical protein